MAEPSSRNFYLTIAEAKKIPNRRVNLFAKISELGVPKKSKGTDYVLLLKLVDESCPPPGLSVNFFAENAKKLPNVRSAGDMISLHHVEMKIRGGKVCCLFGKTVSSFALFNGKTNMAVNPYQISPKFSGADHAIELLLHLRTLSLEHQSDEGLVKRLSLLRNIEAGKCKACDIICKVLHVSKISEKKWILYVWDGTDCPPINFETSLAVEKERPIPLCLEPLPLPKELVCSFPHEGTVLRVFSDGLFEDIRHFRGGDRWIKLCNVTCEVESGLWKGVVNSGSRLFVLSDEVDKVIYRNRIYNERCLSALERMPLASFPEPSYIAGFTSQTADFYFFDIFKKSPILTAGIWKNDVY